MSCLDAPLEDCLRSTRAIKDRFDALPAPVEEITINNLNVEKDAEQLDEKLKSVNTFTDSHSPLPSDVHLVQNSEALTTVPNPNRAVSSERIPINSYQTGGL
ncbi:hypothetical protein C5167_041929 [Papaver somniferum]|nr:hypothetical protein C5167_041929 [Papaver somniferum]